MYLVHKNSLFTSFVWIELGEDDVKLRREQWQALRRKSGLWELDNSYCLHGRALLGEINHVSYFGDVCKGCWRVSEMRTSHGQGHLWLNWEICNDWHQPDVFLVMLKDHFGFRFSQSNWLLQAILYLATVVHLLSTSLFPLRLTSW